MGDNMKTIIVSGFLGSGKTTLSITFWVFPKILWYWRMNLVMLVLIQC